MRTFLKKHALPMGILVSETIIIVVLYCTGFRITYSPMLENKWDAISATSGWVSVIVAAAAVAVAIVVANRQNQIATKQNEIAERQVAIAEQQNKIALFEKRFDYYEIITTCITIGELMPHALDAPAAISLVVESFEKGDASAHFENDKTPTYIKAHAIDCYDRVYKTIQQGDFLFNFKTAEYTLPIVNELLEIVQFTDNERANKYHRFAFTQYAEKAQKELLPQIESVLKQIQS